MPAKLSASQRTLFLLVHCRNWHVGPMPLPANHSLLQSVALRLKWGDAIAKIVQGSSLDEKMDIAGRLEYYDWDLTSLSEEALVRTVPKPGVVFALDKTFKLSFSTKTADRAKQAAVCVILLTPNSLGSEWVMCEAGAFWALEKPIVAAFLFAEPRSVPEPIALSQGMQIHAHAQRKALCRAVKQLCGY